MENIGMSIETIGIKNNLALVSESILTTKLKLRALINLRDSLKVEFENKRLEELKIMDYELYLQTDEWQHKRLDAIDRAKGVCERCGSRENLSVHHKTYERRGEELPEDLITLCQDCHKKEHGIK